jgi:hypothetical protein
MIVPSKNQKTYGVLHTENYFSFLGFCKKVNSDEIQKVDVYLDDKRIDTIIADKHLQKIEDIYELDGFGFSYNLPEEYIGQKSLISFKNHETQENLQNSPYSLVDTTHPKFNESRFLFNLSQPVNKEEIKDNYCPNSIGFLAIVENLEDEEFVQYIKELSIRFPNVELKGFCLNNAQKKLGEKIFFNNEINFLIPQNIYEIAKEIEIYLCSQKVPKDMKIFSILRINSPQILSVYTNLQINNFKQMDIKNFEKILSVPLQKFMDNFKILGFAEDELSIDKTYTKTFQKAVYKRFHLGEDILNDKANAYEYLNFKVVEYALKNKQFKKFYFNIVLGQIEVLFGGKI